MEYNFLGQRLQFCNSPNYMICDLIKLECRLNQYFNMILINARLSYVHHFSVDNIRAYRLFRHILFISVLLCVCVCVCVFVQESLCLHCIMNLLNNYCH